MTKKKIVWVEDDQLLGALMSKKIAAVGYDLHTLKNGKDAVEYFASKTTEAPDLIVVDLLLPDMSGYEILDSLNKNPRFKDVPRIVLSNLGEDKDQQRAHLLGAMKFLVKALNSLDQVVIELQKICPP